MVLMHMRGTPRTMQDDVSYADVLAEVGDALELETYRKGFMIAYLAQDEAPDESRYIPPMRGQYFDIVLMQADVPIVEKRYTLVLPACKSRISQENKGTI